MGTLPTCPGVFLKGMPLDGCKTTIDHDVENLSTSRDIGSGDTDSDLVPFGLQSLGMERERTSRFGIFVSFDVKLQYIVFLRHQFHHIVKRYCL